MEIPAAPGRLVLGKSIEDFLANLSLWSKPDYEAHWKRELTALLQGAGKIALIVSYADPKASSNLEIWRVYSGGDVVYFQNQLPWYESFPPGFDVHRIREYISDRSQTGEGGELISEWRVARRDIESFLRRSVS